MSVTKLKNHAAKKTSLEIAKQVLQTEANALHAFADILDERFEEIIDLMSNIEGRIIVTGMGKSGHIARKIAATMASTGTPAFFVHPGEASHGDMGMIVRGDVVLAFSNSGESKELNDLIEYTRRFAIPLVGVTAVHTSTLSVRSDIAVIFPEFLEACPNQLAPTTSTTLSLAFGDALAVALLEHKGFTANDFKVFHPGGKLGQQLLSVTEIMHKDAALPVVLETTNLSETFTVMTEKMLGCIGLTDSEGVLTGIITDGDIRRHLSHDLLNKQAKDIMTTNPKVIETDTLVGEAMAIMNGIDGSTRKVTCLFVVDQDKKPMGVLHIHDCLRAGFA